MRISNKRLKDFKKIHWSLAQMYFKSCKRNDWVFMDSLHGQLINNEFSYVFDCLYKGKTSVILHHITPLDISYMLTGVDIE